MTESESARINGAKSRGPKTEAGRLRSSQNALKHGLTAQTIVLPCEDPAEYQQLLDAYLAHFQPRGPAESDLIHEMVAAKWRQRRLALIETQLLTESIDHIEDLARKPLSPVASLTSAFERLANSNSYPFLHRVESRLERTYSRALRNLLQLQRLHDPNHQPADPLPPEIEICTNEPTHPAKSNGHLAMPVQPPGHLPDTRREPPETRARERASTKRDLPDDMQLMPLEIKQRETEGIVVLDLKGRLVLGPDDVAFRQALEFLLATGKKNVILNLRDVQAVDTAGVGSMVFASQRLHEAGGRLVLLNIVPSHTSLDDLLKLDTTFDTYAEELAAVNSFFPDRALPRYDLLEFLEEEREHHAPPPAEKEPA